jgi:hypothetical protein
MKKTIQTVLVIGLILVVTVGCSKKQVMPGVVAGAGGVLFLAGTIYRAAQPEGTDGLFGETGQQMGVTASLMLSGLALMLAGVLWSAITPICESDADCWVGDKCQKSTKTCVIKAPEEAEVKAEESAYHLIDPLNSYKHDRFRLNLTAHDL